MIKTAVLCLLVAGTAFADDSPLVAAAKRTNRANPKAKVITNDMVANSKGRLSFTTTSQAAVNTLPKALSTSVEDRKPAAAKAQTATAKGEYHAPGYVAPTPINGVPGMQILTTAVPKDATWVLPQGMGSQPQSSQAPTKPVSSQTPVIPQSTEYKP